VAASARTALLCHGGDGRRFIGAALSAWLDKPAELLSVDQEAVIAARFQAHDHVFLAAPSANR